ARRAGVEKFVYTSTVATIAVPRQGGLPNEETQSSVNEMIGHYKRSKFEAEQCALRAAQAGFPVVIVNPTTPVGPGDWKPTPTGKIIVDFLNGRMPAYVDTGLNFVPVEDAAAGHLLAAERGRIGERYILGGENLSLRALLGLIAEVAGRAPPRIRLTAGVLWPAALAFEALARFGVEPLVTRELLAMSRKRWFYSSAKARAELGFAARPVRQAVADAVAWFRAQGMMRG
ncbi:MAG: NAD-dependent epimerase/dehydratase family protein, partial [Acetobacteraceae bacterium]